MAKRLNAYILFVFFVSFGIAIFSGPIHVDLKSYTQLLIIYLLYTILCSGLETIAKAGRVNIDYSVSFGLSFGLITGPLGNFLFEVINRFYVFLYRKKTNIADEDEFLQTFYNIGVPSLLHSLGLTYIIGFSHTLTKYHYSAFGFS